MDKTGSRLWNWRKKAVKHIRKLRRHIETGTKESFGREKRICCDFLFSLLARESMEKYEIIV